MSISDLKEIKHVPIDLSEFDLKGNEINDLKKMEVPSSFNVRGKQWVLKVSCIPVTKGDNEYYPSELFNLNERDGVPCGWSDQGSLRKFLDKMGVSHPEELHGKEVTMRVRKKDNSQYLGFYK
tara:strand:- start:207 stop:575 length:369 start_codon:yes stop_codon:yes gene_type:complete